MRRYAVSSASVHDSQKPDDVFDPDNTASGVWADSAYRSQETQEKPAYNMRRLVVLERARWCKGRATNRRSTRRPSENR